jgi:hypothetical protein
VALWSEVCADAGTAEMTPASRAIIMVVSRVAAAADIRAVGFMGRVLMEVVVLTILVCVPFCRVVMLKDAA